MKPCTKDANIRECFDRGGGIYESLKQLIDSEPQKYGNLIADIMKIRCVDCKDFPAVE